jgi:hypothetical protein
VHLPILNWRPRQHEQGLVPKSHGGLSGPGLLTLQPMQALRRDKRPTEGFDTTGSSVMKHKSNEWLERAFERIFNPPLRVPARAGQP